MSVLGEGNSRTKGLKQVRKNLDQRLRSRWLVDAEVPAGEGEALGHGGQFLEVRFHEFDPMHEAGDRPTNNFVPWPGLWAEPYPGIN